MHITVLRLDRLTPQKDTCLATGALGGGFTLFLLDRGISVNFEIGVAHGANSNGQLFGRVSATGLMGGGLFGAIGGNGTFGTTSDFLSTGYSNDKVLAGGAGWGPTGEVMVSTGETHGGQLADPSATIGLRGGGGGYIAAGTDIH